MPKAFPILRRAALIVAATVTIAMAQDGAGAAVPAGDLAEPSVTEAEAAILRNAEQAARTDPAQAAAMLIQHAAPEGSGALDFAAGVYLAQDNRPAEAVAAFGRALVKLSTFHRARSNLAKVLIASGDHAQASEHLRMLVDQGAPNLRETWAMLAFSLLSDGHALAAESAYRQALIHDPSSEPLRLGLIKSLMAQGRLEQVAPMAREELKRSPHRREFWAMLANLELEKGNDREALELLECARRLGCADGSMLAAIGDLYLGEALPEAALEAYGKAATAPAAPLGRLLGGLEALVRSDLTDPSSCKALADAIEGRIDKLTPAQMTRFLKLKGQMAVQQGQVAAGIESLEDALKGNPLDGDALLLLAKVYSQNDETEKARRLYQRAAKIESAAIRALTAWAQMEVEAGDYSAAEQLVVTALKRERDPALEQYLAQIRRVRNLAAKP